MGMDLTGKNAASEVGEYFRRNAWGWRPLATMCCEMFPEITSGCTRWQTNDGDGLDSEASVRLADALDAAVASGRVREYVNDRDATLAVLPRLPCQYCNATGVRDDDVGRRHGMTSARITEEGHPRYGQLGTCNACHGHGTVEDNRTWYKLDEDDAREFAAFLRDSGGFEIH